MGTHTEVKLRVDELLAEGKSVQISPQGYSMYPLLVPGRDQVVIVPATKEQYKRGDVVLYRRDGGILVLHRIWKRKKDGYYMVGDNQKEIEGPLRRDQILGEMVCVIRRGRRVEVRHPLYRLASGVWLWLRPVRPFLSHLAAGAKRFVRGLVK
ncbi:MAG: S24/S26 family peptidase [Lachnospiraceae bacterium]|nr:S24/S26 family peptidase [Lachnospiraceae bacterium]